MGMEFVDYVDEIGRVGGRCIAMRIGFERKNGNGMRDVCRSDY